MCPQHPRTSLASLRIEMITDFLDGEIDFLHELLGKACVVLAGHDDTWCVTSLDNGLDLTCHDIVVFCLNGESKDSNSIHIHPHPCHPCPSMSIRPHPHSLAPHSSGAHTQISETSALSHSLTLLGPQVTQGWISYFEGYLDNIIIWTFK